MMKQLNINLTHLLNEDLDYSLLPYGLKMDIKHNGIDIEINPDHPDLLEFYSESGSLDCIFEVSELDFGASISYYEF